MSDAHLGYGSDDVERAVISFFRHVATRAGSLVINGDLFEFWFEWRSVIHAAGFARWPRSRTSLTPECRCA
jgi:UDP-2,3-diacylglucosamine hydrolase